MGKRIISQRRGRGTTTYRSPSFKYLGKITHRPYDETEKTEMLKGKVLDFVNCPGHTAPLAVVSFENGDMGYIFASEGMHTNQVIYTGQKAPALPGNTTPLKNIQIGTEIHNIESQAGDGGKFMRAAGAAAFVSAKTSKSITVTFPSKRQKQFNPECRASIGKVAGSGRKEQPLLKAGKKMHIMRAKNKLYPRTSGVAMNAVDHPFGSGRGRHVGKPKTIPRNAPPGRKVGYLRSKRTGRKK